MITQVHSSIFDEHAIIHELKHYLPAQSPLKDFVHHNTLHAFQNLKFNDALHRANSIFGYKTYLGLDEYRKLYKENRISEKILEKAISDIKGPEAFGKWKEKLLSKEYDCSTTPRIGRLRANWKKNYGVDLDSLVHPILFRILCSYLDQGISMWHFPVSPKGFLSSIRNIEKNSYASLFRTERAKHLFLSNNCGIEQLLKIIVGDESLYKQYLYDQQFAHQGWSGLVSSIEDQPENLISARKISTHDLIVFELLLEIDALDFELGKNWKPISYTVDAPIIDLFADTPDTELNQVTLIWQNAFEWSYYDEVLAGLLLEKIDEPVANKVTSFQAIFCIDDRESSFRSYLEKLDTSCETYATPGFFSVEFYYQPEHGKFYTKLCPAPVFPKYLIKEQGTTGKRQKDLHFDKQSHSLLRGSLISPTLGFWSAVKLFINIFKPSMSPATSSSLKHMDKFSKLTIENTHPDHKENGLQIGFTIEEMTNRVESLLRSIGLIKDFAPIIYVIGHGASTINNPHYAAYDCGACCGRPGSVNARVFSLMANKPEVRAVLKSRGIEIPVETQFVGGLHDTTRDEIVFFDEQTLSQKNLEAHLKNESIFAKAADNNAKERSRRFESINTKLTPAQIHDKIKIRSVSLFEPRPELNHATNALCVIGRRSLTKHLFLDRRLFLNSYDYATDPDGKYLLNILKAAAPVCGGINLEYYFSRVDNHKLGAGTKLPHNVMGLIGVANGIDGDLRPGLPSQMIEVHDPVRILFIVEHDPEVVLKTIQVMPETYEWFDNEWVQLVVINPDTKELFVFKDEKFERYMPIKTQIATVSDITPILESNTENLPVYLIS